MITSALQKLQTSLEQGDLDTETVTFITNKLQHTVTDQVMAEVAKQLGDEAMKRLTEVDVEASFTALDEEFTAKTGQSIGALREEIAEKMVAEFEAA